MPFNWFDLGLVLLVAFTTWAGFRVGLVREILGLAGFLVGIAVAGQLYQNAAASLWPLIQDLNLARATGFMLVFLIIWMLAGVIGQVIHTVVHLAFMGWPDRVAGLVFGVVSGIVLAQVSVILAYHFPFPLAAQGVRFSTLAPMALRTAAFILSLLPPEFQLY